MNRLQWTVGGTGLAILAALAFGLYRVATTYYDFGAASAELPQAVADYRAAGLPFVAADLAPPHLAPAENAAPAIRAALKRLPPQKVEADLQSAAKFATPVPDSLIQPYAKALAGLPNAPAEVDFARDWDLGPRLEFPELKGLKRLARAAALRAANAAERGDDDDALRDLDLARRIVRWAGAEPTLIAALVGIASERLALDGAERCLVAAKDDPARLARYAAWLRNAPPLPDPRSALRGEAWMGLTAVRNLGRWPKDDEPFDPKSLLRDGAPDDERLRGLMARVLQVWTEAARETNGFRVPPLELAKRMDAIEERWDRKRGWSQMVVMSSFPVFSGAGRAFTGLQARRTVEAAFAEALATHARTGRWPTAVAQTDPFTHRPLLVRADAKGFRVYSVGQDGKDDGGRTRREAPKGGQKVTWDEVAAYPPVR